MDNVFGGVSLRAAAQLGGAALMLVLSAGCYGAAADEEARRRIAATYDEAGRLSKLAYDSNGNGTSDTWAYMQGTRLIRLEADEDEDGRLDRWEYYEQAPGAGGTPQPLRIERATRGDGKVTRRELFEGGRLAAVEEDTTGDGAIDKWETYAGGVLASTALDTEGRGKPDRRLIYRADGSLERIEVDPTGSGRFQPVKP